MNGTMGCRYAVLGAGRQGTACAYDVWGFGEPDGVLLADQSAVLSDLFVRELARRGTEVQTGVQGLR
jgi:hypothetical protein